MRFPTTRPFFHLKGITKLTTSSLQWLTSKQWKSRGVSNECDLFQGQLKNVKDRKPNLEEVALEADSLLESSRLDMGDAERVERYKEELNTRYTTLIDRLMGTQNR